ncbi:MAG: hypothetical protein J0I77_06980 [Rudaea sp.]|uniref:hypothetical protein n=1 Tax=unclassified Rudaea TaxID=2627037 RepID=UPI0010F4E16E|nr:MULTISPECIES: hypothetical protein [unclassified Rudaea]MBN8885445.1 hypothetical protein [Rudaea sp.]MBR0344500.1 hypothetical protein [Rudaea sp.]
MRQFVPMTDEMLYRAGGPPCRLVPYRAGLDCWHALGEDGYYRFEDESRSELPGRELRERSEAANDVAAISPQRARPV